VGGLQLSVRGRVARARPGSSAPRPGRDGRIGRVFVGPTNSVGGGPERPFASAPLSMAPGGSGGAESGGGVVAVPGSRSLHRHHRRLRRPGRPGTGAIPAPRSRSRSWWWLGGRREAAGSAIWFGPGQVRPRAGSAPAPASPSPPAPSRRRVSPASSCVRRWSADSRAGKSERERTWGVCSYRCAAGSRGLDPAARRPGGPGRGKQSDESEARTCSGRNWN
jgi:hypothetical protein